MSLIINIILYNPYSSRNLLSKGDDNFSISSYVLNFGVVMSGYLTTVTEFNIVLNKNINFFNYPRFKLRVRGRGSSKLVIIANSILKNIIKHLTYINYTSILRY